MHVITHAQTSTQGLGQPRQVPATQVTGCQKQAEGWQRLEGHAGCSAPCPEGASWGPPFSLSIAANLDQAPDTPG